MKYEEVYLKAYQDGTDARRSLDSYFRFSNIECLHQALGYRTLLRPMHPWNPTMELWFNPHRQPGLDSPLLWP